MKQLSLFLSMFLLFSLTYGQSPGGIGTSNLSGWWDASTLATGNVTTWNSSYPSGGSTIALTESGSPYPQATNTPANASSNYNTTIDFNGNNASSTMVLENRTNLDLLDHSFSSGQGSFFVAYYLPSTSIQAGCHIVNYREGSSGTVDGIQLRAKLGSGTGRCAIGTGNSANASNDWVQDFKPDIVSFYGNRSGSSTYHTFERAAEFSGGISSGTSGSTGLHVGARRSGTSNYSGIFDGFVSEIIFFDRDLNSTEFSRVHTYLSIKYGVPLSNSTGGGDYIASNGDLVWDASDHPGYHNDIVGIARDDASGLLQKQSHTFTDDFRLYIDTLRSTNAENTGMMMNNSYVIVGNDQGALCGSAGAGAESPANSTFYLSRISREWKISRNNFTQFLNLDLALDTCNLAGPLDPTRLHLLVDDDGNFSDATAFTSGALMDISYASGRVTITGISSYVIPNDSTTYITIAYGLPLVTLATDTTICEGGAIQFNFSVSGSTGPVDVQLNDGSTTITYSNVSDGDPFSASPTSNTTYTVLASGPLNCCQVVDDASSGTVTVAPGPSVSATIVSPTSICEGEAALVIGSGALSYSWTGGINNGQPFTPTSSATYIVTGTDMNGCQDTASAFIEVYPAPNIDLGQDTLVCTVDTLVLQAGDFVSYQWQNGSSADTFIVSSIPGMYTYSVLVTDSNGCSMADTVLVDVSVCTSTEDQFSNLVWVYPNPAKEVVTLQSLEGAGEVDVQIADAFGRTVYRKRHDAGKSQLDVSRLTAGNYFIEVKRADFRKVFKVVLQ